MAGCIGDVIASLSMRLFWLNKSLDLSSRNIRQNVCAVSGGRCFVKVLIFTAPIALRASSESPNNKASYFWGYSVVAWGYSFILPGYWPRL